ncbi:MAG: NrsF family protein [Pseudotabrizicola sp.]|uniref:NrsF family protein n=1 Tax=Pseudotabrizicola sp. TaxID=2939647 RepID=UPI00271A5F77|nr:NrsF family protein [Pseudotabrizicola sp.]MDO8881516.1 NrsF family protein [Pseudotabrizicola sp.]MDP2080128.1 NrsF family protein [Pseudotabrizicola sp.]MDZ7575574.1 NrsF family protein [Pseudotabrizicola sp.]
MKTDDLIRALAGDSVIARAPQSRLVWLLPALALGFVGLWSQFGLRTDLGAALLDPVSVMRFVLGFVLGAVALAAGMRLARPGAVVQLWPLAIVALVALGLWLWAFVQAPTGTRQMAIIGKTMVGCLTTIPLLAVLPTVAVLAALRQGAVVRPMLAGAVAGLAGGGLAAVVYALHCTEDSPLFYVTWYGTAILGVAAVSALAARQVLRW